MSLSVDNRRGGAAMCDEVTITKGPSNGKGATVLATFACGQKMAAFRSGPSSWTLPAPVGMAYVHFRRRHGLWHPRVSWSFPPTADALAGTPIAGAGGYGTKAVVKCLAPSRSSFADRDEALRHAVVELHRWMSAPDVYAYWRESFGRVRTPEPVA